MIDQRKKHKYLKPSVELFNFKYSDVIRTSTCYGQHSTPHMKTFNNKGE